MNIKTNNTAFNDRAITALYDVIDPEINLNIVDLGLVYETLFDEVGQEAQVIMTLTTRFCPMGESIVESATAAMQSAFPDFTIQVKLTFNPPWNQDMISEEGLAYLSM